MRLSFVNMNGLSNWNTANTAVIWGWKRDSGRQQRAILFGGSLSIDNSSSLVLKDWFFYYRSRSDPDAMGKVVALLNTAEVARHVGPAAVHTCHRTGMGVVELAGGPSIDASRALISRLLKRRPRKRLPHGMFPVPTIKPAKLTDLCPMAAYVGSGLSYESGLPTLSMVHETFGVDRRGDEDFTFGADDPVPQQLASSVSETFGRFVGFHLDAAAAIPSRSHEECARLFRAGLLTRLLTDNVDNLFSTLSVPFTRTRGIGIFNDPFPVVFDRGEKTLLVVGVAADRRSIIRQARAQGLRVVIVNPEHAVSPKSQNLSYMRRSDTWYRMTADEFLTRHVYE